MPERDATATTQSTGENLVFLFIFISVAVSYAVGAVSEAALRLAGVTGTRTVEVVGGGKTTTAVWTNAEYFSLFPSVTAFLVTLGVLYWREIYDG